VYDADAPHIRKDVWDYMQRSRIPVLGICYGLQEIIHQLGGEVVGSGKREYGYAELTVVKGNGSQDPLFCGLADKDLHRVWMSHGDKVKRVPSGFEPIAFTSNTEYAAVSSVSARMWGIQFHPEVTHTVAGCQIIRNFVIDICKATPSWNMDAFASTEIERLREMVGDRHVIGALSGGVDSTVAAALLHRAVRDHFHGFLIDTGLLRKGEAAETILRLQGHFPGMKIECRDASEAFFKALEGVTDPEAKRKAIGALFIAEFEMAAKKLDIPLENTLLLQGTLYPDVIESVSFKGPSHTIKTHHNVGGLPEKMNMQVLEPLRELFKDEVRQLGITLELEKESVWRHPFPGPGLAIRIIGSVTRERVRILQEADAIFIEEIKRSGDYEKIGQAFVVLLPDTKSIGVMGDSRTYEMTAVLRAVSTSDFMTANWYHLGHDLLAKISARITNEVKGINRVCYDISSKPPATIEWE